MNHYYIKKILRSNDYAVFDQNGNLSECNGELNVYMTYNAARTMAKKLNAQEKRNTKAINNQAIVTDELMNAIMKADTDTLKAKLEEAKNNIYSED